MAGNLEAIMVGLVAVFKKYAGKDGDAQTLSKSELTELALKEFPTLSKAENKDSVLKGVFGQMDMDGDNKVTFKEFVIFFGCLTIALEEHLGR
ncbi:protein S100-G-like [Spea bombifrons]|uniref:protein S100-G-like n=1 Tax=Spea bombifrons TaxID=233779 RepID=UPI002348F35D|nr:protein S100-G-like [Spea bombifrons]